MKLSLQKTAGRALIRFTFGARRGRLGREALFSPNSIRDLPQRFFLPEILCASSSIQRLEETVRRIEGLELKVLMADDEHGIRLPRLGCKETRIIVRCPDAEILTLYSGTDCPLGYQDT